MDYLCGPVFQLIYRALRADSEDLSTIQGTWAATPCRNDVYRILEPESPPTCRSFGSRINYWCFVPTYVHDRPAILLDQTMYSSTNKVSNQLMYRIHHEESPADEPSNVHVYKSSSYNVCLEIDRLPTEKKQYAHVKIPVLARSTRRAIMTRPI